MTEDELMRKYAEAHGCDDEKKYDVYIPKNYMVLDDAEKIEVLKEFDIGNDQYNAPRPLPCVRDEHGEIKEQTFKVLLGKAQEEFIELVAEIAYIADIGVPANDASIDTAHKRYIAEEAADTITAITTLLEALGIDEEMRDEAQRRVNEKNRERDRL